MKKSYIHVRGEYVYVAERDVPQTRCRKAVMQNLPHFVSALSHHLKPAMRDGSQFTRMLFHPGIDGGIPFDSAIESEQFHSHRRPNPAGCCRGVPICKP